MVLAVTLAATGTAVAGDGHLFVGVKKCKNCHGKDVYGDQVSTWRGGPHAGAFRNLTSSEALEIARGLGIAAPPHEAVECLECHVTTHGIGEEKIKYTLIPDDGVQCESCHGAGSSYYKKSVMSDREKALARGLEETSDETCTRCHNPKSPTWDPERYQLPTGGSSGFFREEAEKRISHPIPGENRGRVVELEKERRRIRRGG